MKNSYFTCEFFSSTILLMASSTVEFYRKGDVGKLEINWRGSANGGVEAFHQSFEALKLVKKTLIVAKTIPENSSTLFRFVLHVFREAKRLGVETEIVIPDIDTFEAAEITGFSHFYRVFLTEAEALEQLDITSFYPLALVNLSEDDHDPAAA